MLNRVFSGPYIYSAFCIVCCAIGFFAFGPIGSLVAYGIGAAVALYGLIQRIRQV